MAAAPVPPPLPQYAGRPAPAQPPALYAPPPPYASFMPTAFDAPPHVAALQHLHLAVSSLHAVVELLSMNADAVQRAGTGLAALVERVGQAGGEYLGLLRPAPEGGAEAAAASAAADDARDGARARAKRRQLARWLIGVAVLAYAAHLARVWARPRVDSVGGARRRGLTRTLLQLAAFAGGCAAGRALALAKPLAAAPPPAVADGDGGGGGVSAAGAGVGNAPNGDAPRRPARTMSPWSGAPHPG